MPKRITRVRPNKNAISETIESTSDVITTVIARDTRLKTERYIIFTEGQPLPQTTIATINNLDAIELQIKAMSKHAIDYENKETREIATYLATKTTQ